MRQPLPDVRERLDEMPASGTRELTVRLLEKRADIPLSANTWNALLAQNETNTVFQTYEWFDAWWSTFGAAHQLFFLLVERGGSVIGFAPLMITGRWHRLSFVGTGNADYQDFVLPAEKPAALRAICAFLRQHSRRWHRAWLCNIPSQSSTVSLLREAQAHTGLYLVDEALVACPALQIASEQQAARALIAKYSLRRPLNWFAKHGQVRFRHVADLAEIESLLPAFFDQHRRRWANTRNHSLFGSAAQQAFYRALARAAHSAGWLLFSVVELDGRPIAFHFGFDYRGTIVWYKPAFEIRYAERSPGLLLIRQLIEDALQRGRSEIDFTIGDEPFKERFANRLRQNVFIGMYHSRLLHLAALAVRDARRGLGRRLRALRSHREAAGSAAKDDVR